MTAHDYQIGIEEEYFIVDLRSRNLRTRMPKKFFRASKRFLKERVTNEMLQSQIEVTTAPCKTVAEARLQIEDARRVLAEQAGRHNLGIIAASTHPFALWAEQKPTPEERYGAIADDLQMPGLRTMLCGMHVHVEVPDPSRRVELMVRAIPFLPIFLALSTSSPFWHGRRTGLAGYRLAAQDEMPRTGLPELFGSASDYESYVDALVAAEVVPDASYIWWDIRPALRHPTLELRIPDVCTRVEDAVCIAAMYRCLVKYLFEHPEINARLNAVDRAVAQENKWRAQRYGTHASFIDRRSKASRPIGEVVAELLETLRADAEALGCAHEVAQATDIVKRGSSATHQVRVYAEARLSGASKTKALKGVVDWLRRMTSSASILTVPRPSLRS
jgi:carboxylate-amine ligase